MALPGAVNTNGFRPVVEAVAIADGDGPEKLLLAKCRRLVFVLKRIEQKIKKRIQIPGYFFGQDHLQHFHTIIQFMALFVLG